jgi:formylglycine-generating enzyme required for sulfatase activity
MRPVGAAAILATIAAWMAVSMQACSLASLAYLNEGDAAVGSSQDAGPSDVAVPSDGNAKCPSRTGPPMVDVGPFCIDSTEVTQKDYGLFLAAKANDTSGQPDVCAGNLSYAPDPTVGVAPDMPARAIDWCDAFAYCAWAGKRLCGKIGGGAVPPLALSLVEPSIDQWYYACSNNGKNEYPYGNTYDPSVCAGDLPTSPVTPVGSHPKCEGGFPGIFDMSGNVWEWEDACDDAGSCLMRGGSIEHPAPVLACNYVKLFGSRSAMLFDVGVRCCSP